jgi:hypothetical protein
MKIIVEKDTNLSKYLFEDNIELTRESKRTITPSFIIGDMGTENSYLFTGIESGIPEDWTGCKYTYTTEDGFILNPSWIEPE